MDQGRYGPPELVRNNHPASALSVVLRRPPAAYPGMRIGLLGGSFDPPHEGHRHISLMAIKRLDLDRLWWLVTPGNPLKSPDARQSFVDRLGRAKRTARHPRIDITGFEAAHPDAFTVNTIGILRRRYPGVALVWIMGADNLATFHQWRGWRKILRLVPVAVLDRPGYRFAARASPAARAFARHYVDESDARALALLTPPAWTLLTLPLADISSTEIRASQDTGVSQPGENGAISGY